MALQRHAQRERCERRRLPVSLTSLPCGPLDAEIFEESSHFRVIRNAIRKWDSGACKWHNYAIAISRERARITL